jgi:alcohol dehydrogenase class IV
VSGSTGGWPPERPFRWRDGERLIRFGRGVAAEVPALLGELRFGEFALLTTARGEHQAPSLAESATRVVYVPPGQVPEAAAAIAGDVGPLPPVALGGGRVADTAKALAAVTGARCAAIPTTLAGAEMNGHHRTLPGHEQGPHTRPALVVYDPELAASQPDEELAASAMNALAHATEGLITPRATPVTEMAALRAAQLIAQGLEAPVPDRDALALGGLLGGYVLGVTGFAVHHVVCQTLVRTAGTPHGVTNAVMLPHSIELLSERAPREMGLLRDALGVDPGVLTARAGRTRLRDLGVEQDQLPVVAAAAAGRPELGQTPGGPPVERELEGLLNHAW